MTLIIGCAVLALILTGSGAYKRRKPVNWFRGLMLPAPDSLEWLHDSGGWAIGSITVTWGACRDISHPGYGTCSSFRHAFIKLNGAELAVGWRAKRYFDAVNLIQTQRRIDKEVAKYQKQLGPVEE